MRIVATFGIKTEPDWLVHELMKNLDWVDDFAIVDCRKRKELWIHEGEYRILQRKAAKAKKADWILTTSPDERWEKDSWHKLQPLVEAQKGKCIYQFKLRELYTPTEYRVDGIWGEKKRLRLYPVYPNQIIDYKPIQCASYPQNPDYWTEDVDLNIYHLKHIEPENREMRTKVFQWLDPTSEHQPGVGYSYLMDESNMKLETIPEGREYTPSYRKYVFKPDLRWL